MEEKDTILRLTPGPPDWGVSWDALRRTRLGTFLSQMAGVSQDPAYHGEGDVLAHTQMVCEALAGLDQFRKLNERKRQEIFLAALLHDVLVGKCVGPTSDNYQIMGIDCFYAVPKAVL